MVGLPRLAAAAALFIASAGTGFAQDRSAPTPAAPQVITTGQGEVRVAPDRASISIGVQTRAQTAADASTQNARKQRAIVDAIRAKGIAADQIGTSGFNVSPEMRYPPNASPVLTGYLVSNQVTVELTKTDLVGAVLDAAINAGANQVNSLTFYIANPDSARRGALAVAVARAKGDAEVVARASGGSLGSLIEITTTEFDVPVFQPTVMRRMSVAEAAPATPIEAGTQSVRASVTARWQFVPAPR